MDASILFPDLRIFFQIPKYKRMTSVVGAKKQIPTNALYTNIVDVRSTIFTAAGVAVTWTGAVPFPASLSTIGGALFRDMGKTVYLPDPTVPATVGSQSTIMRKVQLVTGYYGTGAAAAGTAAAGGAGEYFTGYIKLGAQTYGGGGDPASAATGSAIGFVRAN
jgi:hypothetical protein